MIGIEALVEKLRKNAYGTVRLVTHTGSLIATIYYVDVLMLEDPNKIYLVIDSFSEDCVSIQYDMLTACISFCDDRIDLVVGVI